MKKIFFLIVVLNTFCCIRAQKVRDAERLYNDKKYDEAIEIYYELLNKSPKDFVLKCKVGHCLVDMQRYEESIPLLESAAEKRMTRAYLYLYDAYFFTYQFDKAIETLNKFLESSEGAYLDDNIVKEKLSRAELGSSLLARVEDVAILDSFKIAKTELLSVYKLPSEVGTLEMTDESKQSMIYYTGRGDKKIMSESVDNNGQLDLMVAYHLLEGWTKNASLSEQLNTKEDENYPFELADGVTIYFASKGHNALGGYDIFLSRYNDNTNGYSEPVNIGMPFNSPANDYLMVFDEIAGVAWFATDRNQNKDSVVVYKFVPNQEKLLIRTEDEVERIEYAKLKRYREGKVVSVNNAVLGNSLKEQETDINFMVNDGILYTKLEQFVSSEAEAYYMKMAAAEQRLETLNRLIEGKRTEFYLSTIEQDREQLRIEIVQMESDIQKYKNLVKDYQLKTRRAELKELNK